MNKSILDKIPKIKLKTSAIIVLVFMVFILLIFLLTIILIASPIILIGYIFREIFITINELHRRNTNYKFEIKSKNK